MRLAAAVVLMQHIMKIGAVNVEDGAVSKFVEPFGKCMIH